MSLTGHDLESLGLVKGPAYRRILDRVFAAKLDGLVTTPEDEFRLAKTFIAQENTSGSHSKSPTFVGKGGASRDAANKRRGR